ncbi:MAG: chromosome segregation protein SMC, partial [Anaerolineae bacterium]
KGEAEQHKLRQEQAEIEGQMRSAEDDLRRLRRAAEEISLEEQQAQFNHWRTQVLMARQALDHAREREEERQKALEQEQAAARSARQQIEALEAEMQSLGDEAARLRAEEESLLAEVAALQALIEPAEAELAQAESQQDALLAEETRLRKQLSKADQRASRAELNLTRKQETLDRWRERIEADFGLVSLRYDENVVGPTPLPLGDEVEQLPVVTELPEGLGETIKEMRARLRRIGAINPEAQQEYEEVSQRYAFMTEQVEDLHQAEEDIRQVIAELDALMEREFRTTFEAVAKEFRQIFTRLFGGGSAQLILTDPDNLTDSGIEIEARLPGRRTQGLSLLSGGERSLTATALVFALLKVSPTPFCVLDEVDAMLDEANVGRFRDLLLELSQNTQFIVITHNRNTVQAADVIYGITMGRDSASQVISLRLDEVADVVNG